MAKKEEGKIQDCWQCGEQLTCRFIEYQGNTSLQWQNEDGTPHYKFISDGKYECRTSDDMPSTGSDLTNLQILRNSKTKAEEQKLETARLRAKFDELVTSQGLSDKLTSYSVMDLYIEMLELCDDMVITDEIKRSMLTNQANIRASNG